MKIKQNKQFEMQLVTTASYYKYIAVRLDLDTEDNTATLRLANPEGGIGIRLADNTLPELIAILQSMQEAYDG